MGARKVAGAPQSRAGQHAPEPGRGWSGGNGSRNRARSRTGVVGQPNCPWLMRATLPRRGLRHPPRPAPTRRRRRPRHHPRCFASSTCACLSQMKGKTRSGMASSRRRGITSTSRWPVDKNTKYDDIRCARGRTARRAAGEMELHAIPRAPRLLVPGGSHDKPYWLVVQRGEMRPRAHPALAGSSRHRTSHA